MLSLPGVFNRVGELQRPFLCYFGICRYPQGLEDMFMSVPDLLGTIDNFSLKSLIPDRKSQALQVDWEDETFYVPALSDSQKKFEFTFILDQGMVAVNLFYALKDLTGTEVGQFRAPRSRNYLLPDDNKMACDYYGQEFDIRIVQLGYDRHTVDAEARLIGARVYEVSGIDVDKGSDQVAVPVVKVNIGWDFTEWNNTHVGWFFDVAFPEPVRSPYSKQAYEIHKAEEERQAQIDKVQTSADQSSAVGGVGSTPDDAA